MKAEDVMPDLWRVYQDLKNKAELAEGRIAIAEKNAARLREECKDALIAWQKSRGFYYEN